MAQPDTTPAASPAPPQGALFAARGAARAHAADVADAGGVEADKAVNAAGADDAGADVVVAAGCAEAERDAAVPEAVTPRAIAVAGHADAGADRAVAAAREAAACGVSAELEDQRHRLAQAREIAAALKIAYAWHMNE